MKYDSYPILEFKTSADFEYFLKKHHEMIPGIWLKIAKKGTGVTTATYDEALEVVLCFGWIDSQVKKLDQTYYLQKFTPRTSRSPWSQRNVGIVTQLIKDKRMQRAGLLAIESAKKDGRWHMAYSGSKDAVIPEDFLKQLKKDKDVWEFFHALNKSNLFAIYYQLQSAKKPETRQRRLQKIVEMMKKQEKLY